MEIKNEERPVINISVFGPTDHGKSTLIGCLFSNFRRPDFEKYIKTVQQNLGDRYQHDRKYAYVSDRHLSEQIGENILGKREGAGTTQHMHTLEIDISDKRFFFIDSPGHYKWKKETTKSLSRGDHGIFVIGIDDLNKNLNLFKSLIEEDELLIPYEVREYILPLYIALRLGLQLDIIVFSKMDHINYDKKVYEECKSVIRKFLSKHFNLPEDKTLAVPTAIIAKADKNETDEFENVFSAPSKMLWYNDLPLVKHISNLCEASLESRDPSFLPVQKTYFKVPGHKLILAGKIVKGSFVEGDTVKIAPFEHESNSSVDARIKSIHFDVTEEEVTQNLKKAFAGSLVGISLGLDDKYINEIKKEIKKKLGIPYILTSQDAIICCGDVICLQIPEKDTSSEEYMAFEFLMEAKMLLNGKYLNLHFLGYYHQIQAATAYCFKINTPIAAIKDQDGAIIGINPLILKEIPKYDPKERKETKIIRLFSLKTPVVRLGFFKKIIFPIPASYFNFEFLPKALIEMVREKENQAVLTLDERQYLQFKNELAYIKRELKNKFNYSVIPQVEIK